MERRRLRAYSWAEREERKHIREIVESWGTLGMEKVLQRVEARRQAAIHQREHDVPKATGMMEDERMLLVGRLDAIIAANEEAQEEIRRNGGALDPEPSPDDVS